MSRKEENLANLPWKKILISILILAILIGASACQSKFAKEVENTLDAFSQVPDQVGNIFVKIMEGVSGIGRGLADMVNKIIGNMTGR